MPFLIAAALAYYFYQKSQPPVLPAAPKPAPAATLQAQPSQMNPVVAAPVVRTDTANQPWAASAVAVLANATSTAVAPSVPGSDNTVTASSVANIFASI